MRPEFFAESELQNINYCHQSILIKLMIHGGDGNAITEIFKHIRYLKTKPPERALNNYSS